MRFAIVITIILLIPGVGLSTIYVPGDYPTIQDAIDSAFPGELIIVAPGTYVENIDFKGKSITVQSSDGPECTVIDGGNPVNPDKASVVTFMNGEGLDTVLEGFTIMNGSGTEVFVSWLPLVKTAGGGIRVTDDSSPTIQRNIIINNQADAGAGISVSNGMTGKPYIAHNIIVENEAIYGGGISCSSADTDICFNTISNNTAHYPGTYGSGGGISASIGHYRIIGNQLIANNTVNKGGGILLHTASAEIRGNIFSSNCCFHYGGAGLCCQECYDLWIEGNILTDNSALFTGGGMFLIECSSPITIIGNLLMENSANQGGGINIRDTESASLSNNTIYGNSARNGGGLSCMASQYTKMTNSVLWNNSALYGSEIWIAAHSLATSELIVSHCDVQGGQAAVHIGPNGSLDWGAGMIDEDPCFVNAPLGDFHLCHPSPCRDVGDNATAMVADFDFEGDPRIVSGTVDMGADEFHPHLYFTGKFLPSGPIQCKVIGEPGTTPLWLFYGTDVLEPPIPTGWGALYLNNFSDPIILGQIPAPTGVCIIHANLPMLPPGPYEIPMQALIGNALSNLYLLEVK